MVRFLHTADWQLGMRRHYLSGEALPRYMQARIDAVRRLAALAREEKCEFIVVCGDVFESNQVDRQTIGRTFEALAEAPCPVYLLPGNHDPLDAASLYNSPEFLRKKPPHVHVLTSSEPVEVRPGVEVVGVPWRSKKPRRDLVAEVLERLEPSDGALRVGVAHGAVDVLAPQGRNPEAIQRDAVLRALDDGRLHYVALGDRHSATEVAPRMWYSGSQEPTDFGETSGRVLVVELDRDDCAVTCEVTERRVGQWQFVEHAFELLSAADLDGFEEWLATRPDKDRTTLRLRLSGALTLLLKAQLDDVLDQARPLFAGINEIDDELMVLTDELDATRLGLTGFARTTVEKLAARAKTETAARDALALLYRLAGGAQPAVGVPVATANLGGAGAEPAGSAAPAPQTSPQGDLLQGSQDSADAAEGTRDSASAEATRDSASTEATRASA